MEKSSLYQSYHHENHHEIPAVRDAAQVRVALVLRFDLRHGPGCLWHDESHEGRMSTVKP